MRPGWCTLFNGGKSGWPIEFKVFDDVIPDFLWSHALDPEVDGSSMTMLGVCCPDRAAVVPESRVLINSTFEVVINCDRLPETVPDKLSHLNNLLDR